AACANRRACGARATPVDRSGTATGPWSARSGVHQADHRPDTITTESPKVNLSLRLTLILVATVVYLGLAMVGYGGIGTFLFNPGRGAPVVAALALSGAAVFVGGNISSGEREDRGNRWVIAALGAIGLLMGYLPAYSDRHALWTIDGDAVRWLGVVMFIIGG